MDCDREVQLPATARQPRVPKHCLRGPWVPVGAGAVVTCWPRVWGTSASGRRLPPALWQVDTARAMLPTKSPRFQGSPIFQAHALPAPSASERRKRQMAPGVQTWLQGGETPGEPA